MAYQLRSGAVWPMPALFIGSLEQIRADPRERQKRSGLSYPLTPGTELPVLAQVSDGL